jgi:hypothetical protein
MTTSPAQSDHLPAAPATVNDGLTQNDGGPLNENPEYTAFARRVLRAYSRRVAIGDVEELQDHQTWFGSPLSACRCGQITYQPSCARR